MLLKLDSAIDQCLPIHYLMAFIVDMAAMIRL